MYYRRQQEIKKFKKDKESHGDGSMCLGGYYMDDNGVMRYYTYNDSKVRKKLNRATRKKLKDDHERYTEKNINKKIKVYRNEVL